MLFYYCLEKVTRYIIHFFDFSPYFLTCLIFSIMLVISWFSWCLETISRLRRLWKKTLHQLHTKAQFACGHFKSFPSHKHPKMHQMTACERGQKHFEHLDSNAAAKQATPIAAELWHICASVLLLTSKTPEQVFAALTAEIFFILGVAWKLSPKNANYFSGSSATTRTAVATHWSSQGLAESTSAAVPVLGKKTAAVISAPWKWLMCKAEATVQ